MTQKSKEATVTAKRQPGLIEIRHVWLKGMRYLNLGGPFDGRIVTAGFHAEGVAWYGLAIWPEWEYVAAKAVG
jgi:hypothetical protein